MVFLKLAPIKWILKFGHKGKLTQRFIRPFEILDRIGPLAYKLALPLSLSATHNIFHVSVICKYVTNPTQVIDYAPLDVAEDFKLRRKIGKDLDTLGKNSTQ